MYNINSVEFDVDELVKHLLTLLGEKKYSEIRAIAAELPPPDLAEIIEAAPKESHLILFRFLSKELAAETFVEMSPALQCELTMDFKDSELSGLLSEMYLDDMVDMIEEMPAVVVKRILRQTRPEDRELVNQLLKYPKSSAGSVMTVEYVRFRENMTVKAALKHIKEVAIDKETIYTCYVTDKDRHLIGVVTVKDLLLADEDVELSEIMDGNVISVHTGDEREEVALLLDKYDFLAMPVVDSEDRLVGIITVDDAIDVLTEESEADFAMMAAITPTETPYLKTGVLSIWLARIPWLLLLMISSTFSSTILSGFESALPAVLILFVPMLMGTSGNAGGQSSVTVTRGISLKEISFGDLWRVMLKEVTVGTMCGISLGVCAFLKVILIDRLLTGNEAVTVQVALSVAIAIAVSVIVSKLIGAALPILTKKIGLDPAVMASPIITTVVDAISLILYFVVARFTLGL
jgi:magnesium transporter